MTMGQGFKSKAGFRISKRANTYPITVAEADTSRQKITGYDQIPFISEGLTEEFKFDPNKVLGGQAGVTKLTIIGKGGAGNLSIEGHYLGLDQLIACAMGYDLFAYDGVKRPAFLESVIGLDVSDTVGASSTVSKIYAQTANFFTGFDMVGEFIRLDIGSPITDNQVRRITAQGADNGDTWVTIIPDLTEAPTTGRAFEVAAAFGHQFDFAINLIAEAFTFNNGSYNRIRHGVLCFEKDVSIWEWRAIMVESMSLRVGSDGITFEFGLIPFDLDRSSSVNTSSSNWGYSNSPDYVQERLLFADAEFRIDNYSDSVALDNDDLLGISSFELNIKNNLAAELRDTKSTYYRVEPSRNGFREITGSFTIPRYLSDAWINEFSGDNILMANLFFNGSKIKSGFAYNNSIRIYLRSLKITKPTAPISGPGLVETKYDFTCIQPVGVSAGMPTPVGIGVDNSEVIITTWNWNPFNAFMDQNAETT